MSDDKAAGAQQPTSQVQSSSSGENDRPLATERRGVETKKFGIEDLNNFVGHKTVASFVRFVAGPDAKKTITHRELTGLTGGRVVASIARFVQSADKVVAEHRTSDIFDDVWIVADFDKLEVELAKKGKFLTDDNSG